MLVGKNTKKNRFERRNALIARRPENGVFLAQEKGLYLKVRITITPPPLIFTCVP